jgi:predicted nucleic acid-binding protein
LIAHFESTDAHHERAFDLLTHHAHARFGASLITLAEVLVGPAREGRLDEAEQLLASLGIVTIGLPAQSQSRLALLRAETALKMPDCCVLLAAEQCGGGVATLDARLAGAANARAISVVQ